MTKSLFATVSGSYLFGTNVAGSDVDIRGVHIPDAVDIAFQRVKPDSSNMKLSAGSQLDTAISKIINDPSYDGNPIDDMMSFPLHQFLKLAANGEVTTTELLFVPKSYLIDDMCDQRFVNELLTISKHRIVTKDITKSVGFCRGISMKFGVRAERLTAAIAAQDVLNDLLKNNHPMTIFGSLRDKFIHLQDEHEYIFENVDTADNITLLSVCNRGLQYTTSLKNAVEIVNGVVSSYGKRAQNSLNPEKKDWKSIMHAIRVAGQCEELLATGHITFPRPEAARLIDIRNGDENIEDLTVELDERIAALDERAEASTLNTKPDMAYIENMVLDYYRF